MIAVPIVEKSMSAALQAISEGLRKADLVEIRLDYLTRFDLKKLLANSPHRIIVTYRKKSEGGHHSAPPTTRVQALKEAVTLGAGYVDFEFQNPARDVSNIKAAVKGTDTKLILSYHDFKKTEKSELKRVHRSMLNIGADLVKIVTQANTIVDNVTMLELLKNSSKGKAIMFCCGEFGTSSRILCTFFGSYLTFGKLSKESAVGQVPLDDLKQLYRVNKLTKPQIFGLIGNPVKHSTGYIFHNKRFIRSKRNKIYVPFLVDDLKGFMKLYAPYLNGFSVTIPHKSDVIGYLDRVENMAQDIGAVNTVIRQKGKYVGSNTDVTGAMKALLKRGPVKNKRICLIGAGGVGRALAYGIAKQGGDLVIINRTLSKARKLALELNCGYAAEISKVDDIDIIINATSVGMEPKINKSPISIRDLKKLSKGSVVFDSVYTPKDTRLLQEARVCGLRTISGEEMFVNQALEQSNLFGGTVHEVSC